MVELGKHGQIFRCNAGQFYTKSGQPVSGLPRGFTDILFIRDDGKACFVEAKIKPNKPTPEQLAFIEKMQNHNCIAGVVHNVDEAVQLCELSIT